jgi:predicted ester cyclase
MSTPTTATLSNRDIARAFFAEQDRLRGSLAPALCHPQYQAFLAGNPPMDRAGHEQLLLGFYAGIPDAQHTVDEVFADGDSVAVRFTIRGTHTGNFFGIPASNRPVSVVANILMQVRDGRVVRLHGVFDEAGMLRQMGVLPG